MLASSASRSVLVALRSASTATSAARPSTASALLALPPLTRSYAKVRPSSQPPRPPHTEKSQAEKVPKDARAAEAEAQSHAREGTPVQPEATSIEAEQLQQQQPDPTRRSPTSAFDIDTTLATIADEAAEDGKSGKRTGARARSDYSQSSIEKSRSNWRKIFLLVGGGAVTFELFQMSREWDTVKDRERFAGNPLADSPFGRIRLRATAMWEDWNAPVWEKLLPDPLRFPYGRPYTLVIDLDELLVHSHWTREHGWRTAKRPGLDYFLGYLNPWFEIVLFTDQPYYAAGPIIEKLDPDRRYFAYTLFRESCRTENGKVVKDLSHLNRDLSKVVVLDTNSDRFSLHPENGTTIKKWDGSSSDRELIRMVPFLEAIGIYGLQDVRGALKAYEGTYIPDEYNARQAEIKARECEEWKAQKASRGSGSKLSSWIGSLKGQSQSSSTSTDGPPKTFYDVERERFQAAYQEDQKFWRENGPAMRQQAKEDQERQIKEMKLNAWNMFTGGGTPKPPGEGEQTK